MELIVPLRGNSNIPLYEQIYEYIKLEIRQGSIAAQVKLPSTRALAEGLKVSRSTTQVAYDQLLSEGYIESVPYKGYYVANIDELIEVEHPFTKTPVGGLISTTHTEAADDRIDFSPRGIDLNHFPFYTWRKITKNTLVDDNKEMFASGEPKGESGLREVIKNYLHTARGVRCGGEQIIIGAGSEYLLMLLSQILGAGKTIAMENPTYKQAYRVFDSLGYEVVPVEMDRYGLQVTTLEESLADLAYVMPSHQYPMGIVMPVKRRQELLNWAYRKEGRYLIEDDYDSEFRYKGKPIPALQGMDHKECVIYIGTFSRSIAPAIRVSYLVLPPTLLKRYQKQSGFYASTVSRIDQNVLYEFMVGGHFERHLNKMRTIYKAKHDTLLAALKPLESYFKIEGEHAGVHLLLTHKGQLTEHQLIERSKQVGVRVYGLSSYFIHPQQKNHPATIVLGYANLTEEEIVEGVKLLSEGFC